MSSASAAAKTPAVLRRYGTGVIPTPGSKSVPRSRERLLDEAGVPTRRVYQTVSKSCQTTEAKVCWDVGEILCRINGGSWFSLISFRKF